MQAGLLARDAADGEAFVFALPGVGKAVAAANAGRKVGFWVEGWGPYARFVLALPDVSNAVATRLPLDAPTCTHPLKPPPCQELIQLLARRKPPEVLETELLKRKLRSSFLGMRFHVRQLTGTGVLRRRQLPRGPSLLLDRRH